MSQLDLLISRRRRRGGAPSWVPRLASNGRPAEIHLPLTAADGMVWWNGQLKSISEVLTCSRTGTATYTDAAGVVSDVAANTLRYGTNGLLVEESRTNLITRSEDFSTTWSATGIQNPGILTNVGVAPDGTTTADKLVPSGVTTQHRVDFTSTTTNATHTYSIYVKADGYGFVWLRCGSTMSAVFNLSTGATSSVTGTATSELAANGFRRCILTGTADTNSVVRCNVLTSSSTADFAGDTTSGIQVWGAQVELGAFATSYIRTAGSAVTRNADNISFASTTGQLLSRGTWAGEYTEGPGAVSATGRLVSMRVDGSNAILLQRSANKFSSQVTVSGSATALLASTDNVAAGVTYKGAFAYETNNVGARYSGLGTAPSDDMSCAMPTGSPTTYVGSFDGAATFANSHIRSLSHWTDLRAINADLIALAA
jgi:hypothetical protein